MGSGGVPAGQSTPGGYIVNPAYVLQQQRQAAAPQAAPQTAAPAAPNSWQNTMAMLANPGKVTTPGATVPATASAQPGPGALQAFLANWKPAQSGPGSGFQQGFAGALNQMYGGGGAAGAPSGGGSGGGGGAAGMMPPPSQGVPGTAFSQPLQQGGTPSWQLGSGANVGNGNTLAGYGNTPAGSNPFANLPAFTAAQQKLLGR